MTSLRLLRVLIARDIRLRYKQTAGGILWAVIQPLLIMVVFTLLFSKVLGVSSYDVPYPLYVLSGLVVWNCFAGGLTRSAICLVADSTLVKRVRIPRILLPLSACLAPLLDMAVSLIILLIMMAAYGYCPQLNILAVIPFTLLAISFSFGLGCWLSAINVEYRDVAWAVGHFITMALLVTPVAYGSAIAADSSWYWVYQINPMATVVGGFRWALLQQPFPGDLWPGILVAAVVLASGVLFFQRQEKIFADVV